MQQNLLPLFSILAGLALPACSSSSSSPVGGGDAAADTTTGGDGGGGTDAGDDVLSFCGHPGDLGNSLGVGKYCNGFSDCSGTPMAHLCSDLGNPNTHFCTLTCTPPPDGGDDGGDASATGDGGSPCGEGASCAGCQGSICGCLPDICPR